jgi:carbon monoxide dehydrogenase subunit G
MEVTGEQAISEEPDKLWDILLDPDTLEQTIPGAQSLERDGKHYEGTLERGLAGVSLTLTADVDITDEERPNWIAVDIEGRDNTINSHVEGDARVDFEAVEDDATLLTYTANFNFSGKLASLGSRIIKRKVNQDLDTFFSNVEVLVSEEDEA